MDAVANYPNVPFLGEYQPRLDEKGRLILPAKFRARLAAGLVLARGQERCLYVFPVPEFQRRYEAMRTAPLPGKQARDYMRLFLSSAHDDVPDRQGRIAIPAGLRAYAGLDRDVAVIGAGPHVEVWDLAAWNTYVAENIDAYAESSEEVFSPRL